MGVSTTGENGETFPTRILYVEIYWGISPVKSQSRLDIDLSSSMFFRILWYISRITGTMDSNWAQSVLYELTGLVGKMPLMDNAASELPARGAGVAPMAARR